MTSVLNRRHHAADPGSKSVKYTPCSKGEQTDEEELDEIAITTPSVRSRSPRDSGQRSPHTPDRPEEGVTANGPRALPGSVGYGTTASDRTKLIAERLINRSESPIFVSSNRSSSVQRTSSKQSIFEMVSNKIESVKNGGRSKGQSSADDVSTMGYINKAHVPEPPTPKEIRKARKKEIEERFGKRSADCGDRFTDVSDKEGCKWTFVFDPSGRFAYWWSMVVSIAFLYNFWVIIYRFALEEINASTKVIWFTLDYLADFLYVLDVAFHFRTGYLEGGVLQTDATKLRIHYLNSTMFYIDCLCLLPLDMLYLSIGYKSMLRCFRLVKIYRFWAFLDRTERHTNYPNMVRTITLLHYLFAIYHWNACLMYMVMKRLDNNNWVVPNDNADILEKYLHALYWSTLTLTMIGDLPMPRTKGEYVFVIIEFVFGLLLFSTILGHVANIVTGISSARRDFQAKLDNVKTYMTLRRVPQRLQDRVIKWFDYLWLSKKSSDEEKTLGLLPDKLKAEIALHVHLDTLKRVEIFQNTEAGFLCALVLRLKPVLFSPKDYICVKGEVGKEMYIVNRGRLQVVADNGKTILATLKPGSYFGEISILNMGSVGNRRTASVRSVGYSDLFMLSKNDLWEVLKDYPTARVRLEAIAVKRLEKFKKAPLEKAALARSRSTPGIIESSGRSPLLLKPIDRNNTLPPGGILSTSRQVSPCSLHSRMDELGSLEEGVSGSEASHGVSDPESATKMAASGDITHSMTVSSMTSYTTDASAQKSPMATEAPSGGAATSPPPSPWPSHVTASVPAHIYHTGAMSRGSPSQSPFTPIDPSGGGYAPISSPVPLGRGIDLGSGRTYPPPPPPPPPPPGGSQIAQISPFNTPYLAHPGLPSLPAGSTCSTLQPITIHPQASSPCVLPPVPNANSPLSPRGYGTYSPALNAASTAGSLPVSDQSTDALLHEITRLRERLHLVETENASMNLKLSQKQWEVDNRLAEIELHICGSEDESSVPSTDGKDESCVSKESVI